jgi:glyoxylase-like metal-dependent hydrolase (beta-lactamase superfamily II)
VRRSRRRAIRLVGPLYIVGGDRLTHPFDANSYLVAGSEPVLIDCGSVAGYDALRANLARLGVSPHDIRRVVVTHGHFDHVSGMARLREESDAELFVHPGDRAAVESGDAERTSAFLYGREFPKLHVDEELRDGMRLRAGDRELRVVHTPGHTPGSCSFQLDLDGFSVVLSGDTVWGGFHERIGSDAKAWRRSLDRLIELDPDALAIGHSLPMLIPDAGAKLRDAREQFGVYFNPWFKPFHARARA